MRIGHLYALAARAEHRLALRLLHRIEDGIKQVQRDHDQHIRERIASLKLPCDTARVAGDLIRARLRIHAISFDVFLESDAADSVRIRVSIPQVRTLAGIGIGEDYLRANLVRGADGLHKGIGGLHGNVDSPVVFLLVRVEDDRHLRQSRHSAQIRAFERRGKLDRYNLGLVTQDRLAYFYGEFQPSRHDRKISEAASPQTARIGQFRQFDFARHTAVLLLPRSPGWPFPVRRLRARARSPGSST